MKKAIVKYDDMTLPIAQYKLPDKFCCPLTLTGWKNLWRWIYEWVDLKYFDKSKF